MSRRIRVFVEGESDQLSLEALFSDLLQEAGRQGHDLSFHAEGGKDNLVRKTPFKATRILLGDPEAFVFIVPDLYPKNKGGDHVTFEELRALIVSDFQSKMGKRGGCPDSRPSEGPLLPVRAGGPAAGRSRAPGQTHRSEGGLPHLDRAPGATGP